MRQLNVNNLRLSVDALGDNAEKEAHQVLAAINQAIASLNGNPALLITKTGLDAEYEEINDD